MNYTKGWPKMSQSELSTLLLSSLCSNQLVIGGNLVLKMSLGNGSDIPRTVRLMMVKYEV